MVICPESGYRCPHCGHDGVLPVIKYTANEFDQLINSLFPHLKSQYVFIHEADWHIGINAYEADLSTNQFCQKDFISWEIGSNLEPPTPTEIFYFLLKRRLIKNKSSGHFYQKAILLIDASSTLEQSNFQMYNR